MGKPRVQGGDGTKRLAVLALFLSIGISLQLIEAVYLPPLPIPGAKLGLANIVSLILVASFGAKEALTNAVMRTTLASLFIGTFLSATFVFSLSGAVVSTIVMLFAFRGLSKHFSLVGISILGALAHNITQMLVAYLYFVRHPAILFELPLLMLAALISGVANGWIAQILVGRVSPFLSLGLFLEAAGPHKTESD